MLRSALAAPARPARLGAMLLSACALTTLVACGAQADARPAAAPSSPAPAPTTAPPPPTVPWPLTGRASTDPVDHPAVAVKIENSVSARPQTGLNSADLVWETVVEGGISRYVAVFHSALPPEIGPIRSIRPMDPAIAAPLRGLLAFSGGQPGYVSAAAEAGLQVVSSDAGAAGFHRIGTRSAPHNIYADPSTFVEQADDAHQGAPPAQFAFSADDEQPTALADGTPTKTLSLTLSGVSRPQWHWRTSAGAWLRSEGSTPAVEADGTRLRATNVVVLRVDVVNTSARDAAGNPVPETVLVGGGDALVATGGRTVDATWSKAAAADPLVLRTELGNPVTLRAGTTWVELVPNRTGAVSTG